MNILFLINIVVFPMICVRFKHIIIPQLDSGPWVRHRGPPRVGLPLRHFHSALTAQA